MKVTFVYRGGNPFMRMCAEEMTKRGIDVEVKEIEIPENVWKDSEIEQIIGELSGIIVTDQTLKNNVRDIIGHSPINVYDVISWEMNSIKAVVNKLQPIIDEIKNMGREPVVLQNFLGHHICSFLSENIEEEREELKSAIPPVTRDEGEQISWQAIRAADLYSAILVKMGVPIITRDEFQYDSHDAYAEVSVSIVDILTKRGIEPSKAVLLVDHHVYNLLDIKEQNFVKSGLGEIDIVTICPCCIGVSEGYKKSLPEKGFRLLPLVYTEDSASAIDQLESMIKQA